jgi:CheY-like chemotaxis protein
MSQTLVLSVGSDAVLLDTRDQILRTAGYVVISAASINEAVHLYRDGDFDLVVLCHSLPAKDCERLTCFIRASGSRIPIVCVSGAALAEQNAFVDATLDKNPVAFLRELEELLSKHDHAQTDGVAVSHNNVESASARKPPRSNAGVERQAKPPQDQAGTSGSLERTRERASFH